MNTAPKKTILITGSLGQLGSELRTRLADSEVVEPLFIDKDDLDITDAQAVDEYFNKQSIDYCINCAAYTNVELSEKEGQAAFAINAKAVEYLAQNCKKAGTIFFHISTDFVFDGAKTTPYTEEDLPNPLNAYGRTKYEGEKIALLNNSQTFIIRTAWLYSEYGNNFVKTMMRLGKEKDHLDVIADQVGTPTYAGDLADALLSMVGYCEKQQSAIDSKIFGIYHFTNEGVASWYDFAYGIMEYAQLPCTPTPIQANEFPSEVVRPSFSVLDKKKIKHVFNISIPYWRESLRHCIARIQGLKP